MCEENSSLISNNNAYGGIFLPSDNYVDLSGLYVDLSDNFFAICMALTRQEQIYFFTNE